MSTAASTSPAEQEMEPEGDSISQFALPRTNRNAQLGFSGLGRKLSRFMARHWAAKTLVMQNRRPVITFTFDDVPASACVTGARLLEQYQARGTFYVSCGGCGRDSPGGRLASVEQLKALRASGHEIGCHTFSHTAVSGIDREELVAELARNRSFLNGIHRGTVARNFAYPYGDLSLRSKRYLEAHFDSCRSLRHGINCGIIDLGALKACELQDASIGRQGVLDIVAETARRKGWLIFVSHDAQRKPSRYGVSPELLEHALNAARASGAHLISVQNALEALSGSAPTSLSRR
jgi:peptidoglycan/xylan/chitin deacetylase (PgdA/CDA1 family)